LDVRSSDVLGVLLGKVRAAPVFSLTRKMSCIPGESSAIVYCEGICIAVVVFCGGGFRVDMIACDHHSHGVHPRYEALRERLSALGAGETIHPSDCPKCNGSSFVSADSEPGRMAIMLAQGMQMFRGIRLSEDGYRPEMLNVDSLRGTVGKFLSGVLNVPRDASANSPAGVVTGRAPLTRTGETDER
jgi:hypothetical protein